MKHAFDGLFCRKQRKLAKIWRAIARRHLSRWHAAEMAYFWRGMEHDDESDP